MNTTHGDSLNCQTKNYDIHKSFGFCERRKSACRNQTLIKWANSNLFLHYRFEYVRQTFNMLSRF